MIRTRANLSVLIVVGGLGVGGTEVHLAKILPLLSKSGVSVTLFSMTGPDVIGERLAACGIRVLWAPGLRTCVILPRVVRRLLLLPIVALSLLWQMWRLRPDVAHFFLPEAYLVGAICSFLAPVGRRIMSRRSLNSYQAGRPLTTMIEIWLHRKMDRVLANSHAVARQLEGEGVTKDQLRVIENGFDAPEPNITRQEARGALITSFGLNADHFIMVNVANLIPYKGHRDLLAALSAIRTALPQPWILFCVGRDDGLQESLQSMCGDLSIEDNVVFCGSRSDVWTFQRGADLGVFASLEEGSPNAVLELMHAGLPVASTAAGGVVELLGGEQARYVVNVGDVDAFAGQVLELAGDEALRKRMGQLNQRKARSDFSLRNCVAAYREMYLEVAR